MTLNVAGRTHVGLVRRRNEDALHVGRSLLAVADGLGGHPAGDVASSAAIEALRPFDQPTDPANLAATLGRAVRAVNEALRQRIEAEPDLTGMGTTLVALLWSGTTAVVANVGDSRAYVRRRASAATLQLTEDHTYGHLLAEAAEVPDLTERLARWLDGRADGRSPDLTTQELHPGDRFLLCSDGLSSVVPFELTDGVLASVADPGEAADRLITLALDHGGRDNITVIVADVPAAG